MFYAILLNIVCAAGNCSIETQDVWVDNYIQFIGEICEDVAQDIGENASCLYYYED